jgi:hypothetical protein
MNQNIDDAPIVILASGATVANFSSAHPFTFDDGSTLQGCTAARCRELMLHSAEEETINPGGWVDIELRFVMSEAVKLELERLQGREDVDVILVPFPVLSAVKEAGLPVGKCRTVRMADRVSKTAHSDRFCV